MTDLKTLNASFVDFFAKAYGDQPGLRRLEDAVDNDGAAAGLFARWVHESYKERGMTSEIEMAPAYNHLAYELRKLGYGKEAHYFAEISNLCDPQNISLRIANRSLQAYVVAMIAGQYALGLRYYDTIAEYMQEKGVLDEVTQVKILQNKGQIYHRIGMNESDFYIKAQTHFDRALQVLEDANTLNEIQYDQFKAQIYYCYAKTLAHIVKHAPEAAKAGETLAKAFSMITDGLDMVEDTPNFDFDRACFKAVYGEVIALSGQTNQARSVLNEALREQQQFGPTVVPRISATQIKILALDGIQDVPYEHYNLPMARLLNFHKINAHPDFGYYHAMLEAAKKGPVFNTGKINFVIS